MVPNVGIVVGNRAVLVVDTGIGPDSGRHVLDQARRLADGRAVYLSVTQLDPGHAFGAQAFKGAAAIVYSDQQQRRREQYGPSYAAYFATLGEHVVTALRGLQIVQPDTVYADRLELDLGDARAILQTWGPAHTADDQTVLVNDEVLFAGDLLQRDAFPILPFFPPFDTHFDSSRWLAALDAIIRAQPQIVVPGHGPLATVADVREVSDYVAWVRTSTLELLARGASVAPARARIEHEVRRRWPVWQQGHWVGHLVAACFTEATRSEPSA